MKRFSLWILVVVFGLVLAGQEWVSGPGAAKAAPPGWSDPINVSNSAGSVSKRGLVAVTSDGTAHIVWDENQSEVYYASKAPATPSFSSSTVISCNTPGASSGSGFDSDGGNNLHVLWSDQTTGDWDPYYTYKPASGSWVCPYTNVQYTSLFSPTQDLVSDQPGNVHIAWGQALGAGGDIYYCYKPAGSSWDCQDIDNDGDWPSQQGASIAVDGSGTVHMAVQERDSASPYRIKYRSRPWGGSWTAMTGVDFSPADAQAPDIAVDTSGKAHIVWSDTRDGNWQVYYTTNASGSWSAPVRVAATATASLNPEIAADPSGVLHLVWREGPADLDGNVWGNGEMWYSKNSGSGWSAPVNISNTAGDSALPSLDTDSSNNVHVVWQDVTPGNYEIYYATTAAASPPQGSWQITSSLVEGRVFHSTFVGQGSGGTAYLYATGGQDARAYPPTGPRTTERAAILPDGCLGPWEVVQGADLPDVRRLTNAVKVGQYVYLVGGWNTNVAMASTVRAQVRADGKLEHESDGQPVWETMSSMLNDRRNAHAVVAAQVDGHTYLYAIGGTHESMPMATAHRTIERAEVFTNGDLGEWERLATLLPQTSGLTSMAAYVAGGYVYTVGGFFGNSTLTNVVQRAAINSDGTLGPFAELAQAAWPTAREFPAWLVADGVLYLIGGYVGGTYPYVWMDEVDIASLAADGAPEWAVGPSLNVARQYPAAAANGGRIYAVAGRESSPEWGQANLVEVLGASGDCSAPPLVTITPTPTATTTPTPYRTPTPTRTPAPHPPGVGGTVKLPPAAIAADSGAAEGNSDWSGGMYMALAAALSAAFAALGVGGWHARRRWLR